MKKNYIITVLILIIISIVAYMAINPDDSKVNYNSDSNFEDKTETSHNNNVANYANAVNKTFTWLELDITPVKTVEGGNYVFSAFDFDIHNSELVIAKSAENNLLTFISDAKKTEIQIPDNPLDIAIKNGTVYVLGLNKFLTITDKKITQELVHNISNVTTFDKLIFFNNKPTILMADGSSYRFKNNNFIKSNALDVNNTEVWIQKTSQNSFEIKSKPESQKYQKQVSYNEEIGSISFLGEDLKEYYVVLDKIKHNGQRPYVQRELKSSRDNFKETIIELPVRDFSFIKNDIKIHNNTIYSITVTDNNLNIKSYK